MSDASSNFDEITSRIKPLVEELLELAKLRVTVEVQNTKGLFEREFENPDVLVTFSGPDASLLLDNKAEALLALEYLVFEALRLGPEHRGRVMFDCQEYRLMRVDELRLAAQAAADKVRRSGVPYNFSPMNSRERRVVHMALRGEHGVRSQSEGFGPHRHVVIQPTEPARTTSRGKGHHPSR